MDNTDLATDGDLAEQNMQKMIDEYDDKHAATGGHVESKQTKCCSWKWKWSKGNKKIMSKSAKLVLNQDAIERIDNNEFVRTLGVYMGPQLKWNKQFEIMKEKMRESIGKLKNTAVFAPTAHIFFNMHLINKVYFGCGAFMITPKQEEILMKMHEPVTLRKMGFSVKFLRKIVHAQKSSLGIGLMKPSTTMTIVALKLHVGRKRKGSKISKMIDINEDIAH